MTFQQSLNDEYNKLQRLKANIHTKALSEYVDKMKSTWKPKKKLFPIHQNQRALPGEEDQVELFYDEYHHEWTIETIAFKGFLFKKISDLINGNKIDKYK